MRAAETPALSAPKEDLMGFRKRRYVVMIICLTMLQLWLIQNTFLPMAMRLILISVVLLGTVRWTAAVVLVLIQTDLYLYESTWRSVADPPGLIIAVVTVSLLMVMSRLRSAQELTGVRGVAELLMRVFGGTPESSAERTADNAKSDSHSGSEEPLWIAVLTLSLVLAAGQLLQTFPPDQASVREFGLTPTGLRTIQLGLTLFTFYLLITLPLSELRWRQLTPAQAGVYQRSQFVSWLYGDLRAVERRRRRLRLKRLRRFRRAALRAALRAPNQNSMKAD